MKNFRFGVFLLAFLMLSGIAFAQTSDHKIVVTPQNITLEVGGEIQLKATLVDANGKALPDTLFFFSRARRSLRITPEGTVIALRPGMHSIIVQRPASGDKPRIVESVVINVAYPPVTKVNFTNLPENVYAGTVIDLGVRVIDEMDELRSNVDVVYTSSNKNIAEVSYGKLIAKNPGTVTVTAKAEAITTTQRINIVANPVVSISIGNDKMLARTGDVLNFNAVAKDKSGKVISSAPVSYTFEAQPDDNLGNRAAAQVSEEGKFVANLPGIYTLVAKSGSAVAQQVIRIEARNVKQDIEIVGQGAVRDVHTSDLWVWEGVDGRDYALTGTWGANGAAYFWDVTDPSNIIAIDTVVVDARTVNDVKVSEDGRIAVLSREGASNRRNGIVILDVTNPRNVKIISEYTENLTGGVHNVFIYENHVYAVNNGRKYDIINIEDPANPRTVGVFELETEGHSIHDVWIEDGIAYSSNWRDGIVAVDVSGRVNPETGEMGGSPENPKFLGSYAYPSGLNHAAFPFKSKSTGDFYVIAGDESFPSGLPSRNNPVKAAGWIHFVKFDGWGNPKEVARYEVPEAGTHNMWVIDDLLFVAYYNAGLRIVDISGELMGNLYDQGREIAYFEPNDPDASIPNAPFVWGPQPHKGHIFISDWNSGLWAVKLIENPRGTN